MANPLGRGFPGDRGGPLPLLTEHVHVARACGVHTACVHSWCGHRVCVVGHRARVAGAPRGCGVHRCAHRVGRGHCVWCLPRVVSGATVASPHNFHGRPFDSLIQCRLRGVHATH